MLFTNRDQLIQQHNLVSAAAEEEKEVVDDEGNKILLTQSLISERGICSILLHVAMVMVNFLHLLAVSSDFI